MKRLEETPFLLINVRITARTVNWLTHIAWHAVSLGAGREITALLRVSRAKRPVLGTRQSHSSLFEVEARLNP